MNNEKIIQFQNGDRQAFNEVFDQFYAALYNFCKRLTSSPEDGEEITLQTFLKLWQRKENFHSIENIKAFLYITARNTCFSLLQYKKIHKVDLVDPADLPAGVEKDAQSKMIGAEVLRAIDAEVKQLPPMAQKVFELTYYEGLNREEIANKLGISKEAVSYHKSIALKVLRTRLLRSKLQLLIFFIISLFGGFRKNF